ncbi:hypothetical protein ACMGDM_12835 [Sphingomonas sp. DT-51]|uniref:hypothetical protein n=1 Tax=Sphingomonas sp. DT-51 TaxID=3396165 RepID=UPI003F1AB8D1
MDALAAALREVAVALRDARDPWWVIGSAAVRLHGVVTPVADVDVLLSGRDALAAIERWHGAVGFGSPSPRFRSAPFARLSGTAMPIELMAGLEVSDGSAWRAVRPATRQSLGAVFVPDRAELIDILTRFDRQKDRARAALLAAVPDEHGGEG